MAAVEQGGKVLVLTVDPARRLANALGLEGFGNAETRVPDDAFAAAGRPAAGRAVGGHARHQAELGRPGRRHAPDAETREQILANPLYQNISGRFVQSHDYIAMERLYEIHTEGNYDLIVVDTPPTRNALDFLEAPERMADFFSSRLLRWLIVPYRSRLVNMASRPFYQVADRILGLAVPGRHRRVLHPVPDHVRRVRRAGRGGDAPAPGPAHDLRGRVHARGGAGARGRVLHRPS